MHHRRIETGSAVGNADVPGVGLRSRFHQRDDIGHERPVGRAQDFQRQRTGEVEHASLDIESGYRLHGGALAIHKRPVKVAQAIHDARVDRDAFAGSD